MSQNHDDQNSDPTKNSKKRESTDMNEPNEANTAETATNSRADFEAHSGADGGDNENSEQATVKQQVKIDFPFSDVVRAQIPKAFETAEKVATEVKHHWKTEGDFANLGLPHPVADMVATQALQKAKEVEKKLEEKGVFSLAKMGLEIAKSQFESFKKKI